MEKHDVENAHLVNGELALAAGARPRPKLSCRPPRMRSNRSLLNKQEATARLRICLRKINSAMADGTLPYIKFGASVRFLPEDLEAFVQAHRRVGG